MNPLTSKIIDEFREKFTPEASEKDGYEIKFLKSTGRNHWDTRDARPDIESFLTQALQRAYEAGEKNNEDSEAHPPEKPKKYKV